MSNRDKLRLRSTLGRPRYIKDPSLTVPMNFVVRCDSTQSCGG